MVTTKRPFPESAKWATLVDGKWLDAQDVDRGGTDEALAHYEGLRKRRRHVWLETAAAFGALVVLALVAGAGIVWAYAKWGGGR